MNRITSGLVAASALFAAGTFVMAAPAQAADVQFSIVVGDVAFAYQDGYYDRNRRWHAWRSDDERDWYRRNYRTTYYDIYRDDDRDQFRRDWRYGRRNDWRRDRADFAIVLGDVAFAYYDGYYDSRRRWHRWDSSAQRDWYRQYRRDTYFHMRRDRDRDRYRRDWWQGRRTDWRFNSDGPDFALTLGNVVFAYSDGYYDRNRRWHAWRSDEERDWYRRNYSGTYYDYRRDRDSDRFRREWREGDREDWRRGDDDDDRY